MLKRNSCEWLKQLCLKLTSFLSSQSLSILGVFLSILIGRMTAASTLGSSSPVITMKTADTMYDGDGMM